jgi:hypothetical protein
MHTSKNPQSLTQLRFVLTIEPAKSVVTYTEEFGSPLLLVVRCDQRRTYQFDLAPRYYCVEIDRELFTVIDRLILGPLLAFIGFLRCAVFQLIWASNGSSVMEEISGASER